MHFDDRLDTVMRTPLRSDAARRTQYRQLLDILAQKRAAQIEGEQHDEAYRLLGELSRVLPVDQRGRIMADWGLRIEAPRLLGTLALQEPEIARPALRHARLETGEWFDLIPTLPPKVRAYLKGREDLAPEVRERLARIGLGQMVVEEYTAGVPPPGQVSELEDEAAPTPAPNAITRAADIAPPPFISRRALGLVDDDPSDAPEPSPSDADPEPRDAEPPETEPSESVPPESEPLELVDAFDDIVQDDSFDDHPGEDADEEPARAPIPLAPVRSDPAQKIGDLVRRIETFRKAREGERSDRAPIGPPHAPRLPLDERQTAETRITAIEFTTDRSGRIAEATRTVAPMVVGFSLSGAGERIGRAVRRRLPVVDEPLNLPGAAAVEGKWQLDAMPVFDPEGGRFLHFRGRLRRPGRVVTHATLRAEKLRQLLHELRTPVNAIQGFAESIQQQIFGEVPHNYRAYAATIASDSAAMMAGFEELERFARLTGGEIDLVGEGCDFSITVGKTLDQLATYTQPRVSGFKTKLREPPVPIAMSQSDGERIAWRLLGTLAGETAPGEFLSLRLTVQGDMAQFSSGLPRRLLEREGEHLFEGGVVKGQNAITAGMFGSGFALRLARSEARAAGGDLVRDTDEVVLSLPLLTPALSANSEDSGQGAVPEPGAHSAGSA